MNDVKRDAARTAVLTVLRDVIDAEVSDTRGEVLAGLLDAAEALGVKSIDVTLPDGSKVAAATLTQPAGRIGVDSEEAFTAWVSEHFPTEIVTPKPVVRDVFRKKLLDRLVDAGDNDVVDPETGEIVPGLTFYPGGKPRAFSMRFTPTGRDDVMAAWRAGRLVELGTPNPPQITNVDH